MASKGCAYQTDAEDMASIEAGGGSTEGIYYQSIAGMKPDMSGARNESPKAASPVHEDPAHCQQQTAATAASLSCHQVLDTAAPS